MKRRRTQTEAFSLFSFQDIITSVTGVIILVTLLLAVELIKRPPIQAAGSQDNVNEELQSQITALEREREVLNEIVQADAEFLREWASLSLSDLEQTRSEMVNRVDETESSVTAINENLNELIARRAAVESELNRTETESLAQIKAKNAALSRELEIIKSSNQVVYNQSRGAQKAAWLVDLEADRIRVLKPGDAGATVDFSESSEAERVRNCVEGATTRDPQKVYFVLLVRPESIGAYQAVYEKANELKYDLGFDLLASDTEVSVVFPSRRTPQ
jgi:hypothetical protein